VTPSSPVHAIDLQQRREDVAFNVVGALPQYRLAYRSNVIRIPKEEIERAESRVPTSN